MSDGERRLFASAFDDVFTEDSLNKHEEELTKAMTRLEIMTPLIKIVERRDQIKGMIPFCSFALPLTFLRHDGRSQQNVHAACLNAMPHAQFLTSHTPYSKTRYIPTTEEEASMKAAQADPSRLLGRGRGMAEQLKREEKIRNMVSKELPRLTDKLTAFIAEFEEEHGSFTLDGVRVLETLEEEAAAAALAKSESARNRGKTVSSSTASSDLRPKTPSALNSSVNKSAVSDRPSTAPTTATPGNRLKMAAKAVVNANKVRPQLAPKDDCLAASVSLLVCWMMLIMLMNPPLTSGVWLFCFPIFCLIVFSSNLAIRICIGNPNHAARPKNLVSVP